MPRPKAWASQSCSSQLSYLICSDFCHMITASPQVHAAIFLRVQAESHSQLTLSQNSNLSARSHTFYS